MRNADRRPQTLSYGSRLVLAAALAGTLSLSSCGGVGSLAAAACSLELDADVDADFGDLHLDALIEATGRFAAAAEEIDVTIRGACNDISSDLGAETSTDTEVACANAVAAIDDVRVLNPDAELIVEYVPAVCTVNAALAASCTASCDIDFDATVTPITCEGGYFTGTCEGSCSGWCTVEGDISCSGSCTGSCQGSCSATVEAVCEGACFGQCEGACDVYDEHGNCAGACTGTCYGTCEGTIDGACSGHCEGSCQGSCRSTIEAECGGECTGECDVEWIEPRCEGGQVDIDAAAECEASCKAEAAYDISCTDPEVVVSFSGDPVDVAQLEALVLTLAENMSAVLVIQEQAGILVSATADIAEELDEALDAAADIGQDAFECFVAALSAHAEALATVSVSVTVSVDVTASASASVGQ